jgi:hypothetical protein
MKTLRLTEIKSEGFKRNFTRYQLWENGIIIHHCRTRYDAYRLFKALAPYYDVLEVL